MKIRWRDVVYRFDFAAGLRINMAARVLHKQIQGDRGFHDFTVYEQSKDRMWSGLALELKIDGTRLKKKNGEWASEHIKEQAQHLEKMRKAGWQADFAVGLKEAIEQIDHYLYFSTNAKPTAKITW
jgi:hypothetical protein